MGRVMEFCEKCGMQKLMVRQGHDKDGKPITAMRCPRSHVENECVHDFRLRFFWGWFGGNVMNLQCTKCRRKASSGGFLN